jgi:hypothetical protein
MRRTDAHGPSPEWHGPVSGVGQEGRVQAFILVRSVPAARRQSL